MGKGYKHGGSGGAALNFNVKTYPSETELKAAKPSENTIGVITTTTMTSWVFSATEPKEPKVGMVWFKVGTSSAAEFNALKKNALQVYPLGAKQYVSSAWADVVAMSYQNSEWAEWVTYLFNNGVLSEDITGEWKTTGWTHSARTLGGTATIGDTLDLKVTVANTFAAIGTSKMIDLTNYKTLCVEGTVAAYFGVTQTTKVDGGYEKQIAIDNKLDISSITGKWYVVVDLTNHYANSDTRTASVSKIWLE